MAIRSNDKSRIKDQKEKPTHVLSSDNFGVMLSRFCTDGILIANFRSRRVKSANPAICRELGYDEKELMGMPLGDMHPKDIFNPISLKLKGLPEMSDLVEKDVPCLTKDGIVKVFDFHGTVNVVNGKKCIVALYKAIPRPKPTALKGKKLKAELEKQVAQRTRELSTQLENLTEVNTALKMILERRDKDRSIFEEKVVLNVKQLVAPYLKKLKQTGLNARQEAFVAILKENLADIISPFSHTLTAEYINFTASEIRISNLIRQGKKNREIAVLFDISKRTVEAHRDHIRTKLKLKKQKINLRTHLMAIR